MLSESAGLAAGGCRRCRPRLQSGRDPCKRRVGPDFSWGRPPPAYKHSGSAVKCRFHTTIPNEATHVRVLNRHGMRTRAFGSVVMAALCCCAVIRGVGAAGRDVPPQAPWLAVTTANFEMTGPSTEADLR